MSGIIARIHAMDKHLRYPSMVDLFSRRDGQEYLAGVVDIDLLSDLGVSSEAIASISNGEEIEVVCVAAYELPEGLVGD